MRDVWFQALAVQPPRILNTRLVPFSVGNQYLLKRLENPIAVGGIVTHGDLLSAVLLCSSTFEENARRLFGRGIGLSERLFSFRHRNADYESTRKAFDAYLDDYMAFPSRKEKGDAKRKAGAPWEFHTVRVLCEVYGFSASEAWNMGVGLAVCYQQAYAESQGDDSLISPEEEDKWKEQNATVIAANEAYARGDKEEGDRLAAIAQQMANELREDK